MIPPIKISGPHTREIRVGRMHRRAETYWRADRQGECIAAGPTPGITEGRARDVIADALGRVLGIEPRDARKMVDEMIPTEVAQ
jgi:hypothetical protein